MRVYKDKLYSFWASYASMGMDEEVYRITTPSIASLIRLRQELYPVLPLCQRCQGVTTWRAKVASFPSFPSRPGPPWLLPSFFIQGNDTSIRHQCLLPPQ